MKPAPKQWKLDEHPWQPRRFPAPTMRVIVDNDFSGDPDGVWQLAHHLLSPAAKVPLVIGSHLRPLTANSPLQGQDTAAAAAEVARDLFARMGILDVDRVFAAASTPMIDMETPQDTPAVRAVIAEAMRDDDLPLFFAAGASLCTLASAILIEPQVASRLTLVWIGGPEHGGLGTPDPGALPIEYNLYADINAARVCFDNQDLEIHQVTRQMYRQCLVSESMMRQRVRLLGPFGEYLYEVIADKRDQFHGRVGKPAGESYAMGDSPTVLLTALRSMFEPEASSSFYTAVPKPVITSDGQYRPIYGTVPMRVYTHLDTYLMLEDFFAKIAEFSAWQATDG